MILFKFVEYWSLASLTFRKEIDRGYSKQYLQFLNIINT